MTEEAWEKHQRPTLHDWVYGLKDGLINPLLTLNSDDEINPIFHYQNINKKASGNV